MHCAPLTHWHKMYKVLEHLIPFRHRRYIHKVQWWIAWYIHEVAENTGRTIPAMFTAIGQMSVVWDMQEQCQREGMEEMVKNGTMWLKGLRFIHSLKCWYSTKIEGSTLWATAIFRISHIVLVICGCTDEVWRIAWHRKSAAALPEIPLLQFNTEQQHPNNLKKKCFIFVFLYISSPRMPALNHLCGRSGLWIAYLCLP